MKDNEIFGGLVIFLYCRNRFLINKLINHFVFVTIFVTFILVCLHPIRCVSSEISHILSLFQLSENAQFSESRNLIHEKISRNWQSWKLIHAKHVSSKKFRDCNTRNLIPLRYQGHELIPIPRWVQNKDFFNSRPISCKMCIIP